ncbi:uncharacterized protein LOC132933554 [Metopolophium dirhodum]|uniref:uncharacterized protein LOC132933554 n=1 Tax=Metopolophium dirhodum TaxID=44670 RepID=UPI00299004D4|nr:uncharacterized protein LOC132933554 [Metopolophium dirhodum]
MAEKEVPETIPKLSETTSDKSKITMKQLTDEINLLTKDEINERVKEIHKFMAAEKDHFSFMTKDFHEFIKYIPSWLLKENYEQEFDPKFILSHIAAQNSDKKVMFRDIHMMIKLGIERGNNLEKIAIKSSPELKIELIKLRMKYKLVSKAINSKSGVTLSRVCESFPRLTCVYLKDEAKNPIVPFELMETICKNYPRVMMTSAFAYLIPNKESKYCLFLKKAHLLHQYQLFATISQKSYPSSSVDVENEFISKVYVSTQAAINGSHVEYDDQIKFLKENDLIEEVENEMTVTEGVLEAVKLWDEKESQLELDHKLSGIDPDDYTSWC